MALLSGRRAGVVALLLACVAGRARAHIVPIPPSLCGVDPIGIAVPAMGLEGTPAGAAGRLRIVFDANASTVRFCPVTAADPGTCADPVPWPFTIDGVTGMLALPAKLGAVMAASGDVGAAAASIVLTLGSTTLTAPVVFSTGLALADGVVVEGAPLQGAGSWTMVAVVSGDGLPPPLTGHALVLEFPCPPRPVPDKDQFVPASVVRRIAGQVTPTATRLRATIALGPADRPALATGPLLLALHVDDATVATAALSGGLVGGRRPSGQSDDGRTTVAVRTRSARRLVLAIEMHDVALPPRAPGARALVSVTLQTRGLLARGEQLFHADLAGTGLHR